MDLEALADAVETFEVPPTCDGLRQYFALMDRLEAKIAAAIAGMDATDARQVKGT